MTFYNSPKWHRKILRTVIGVFTLPIPPNKTVTFFFFFFAYSPARLFTNNPEQWVMHSSVGQTFVTDFFNILDFSFPLTLTYRIYKRICTGEASAPFHVLFVICAKNRLTCGMLLYDNESNGHPSKTFSNGYPVTTSETCTAECDTYHSGCVNVRV